MNKNQYRLVFSRVRGMLVAVEETANSAGKATQGETVCVSAGGLPQLVKRFALRHTALAVLIVAGVVPTWAIAQIVPGGANAPSVIQTPNGLPQVNINRPVGGGAVSLNTYNQFDVSRSGAILNNSPVIVNTTQAGVIGGNPNFLPGQSARLIVNQVNSNNPSLIQGYVEIAGAKANLILANPSGLILDGGGFLNTSRATLTTGTPLIDANGNVTGINVTQGNITVQGAGFNASNLDQVDLLARAVKINAATYGGNTLNVVAGANHVDYGTLAATPIAGVGAAPAIGIDVSQLGGMYAGKILLASNEYGVGVGVSNAGVVAAQAGDLNLQSNGRLVLSGRTEASGNIAMTSANGVTNSGTTYAQQSVSVNTGADVANTGTLAAQQNTSVNAGSVTSTGTLGAGVSNDGSVGQSGDLTVLTNGQLNATGQNIAGGNATLAGSGVNLAGSKTAANGGLSMSASAGDVNLTSATTSAQGAISAQASGAVINDHGAMSGGSGVTLAGSTVSNQAGQVSSTGPLLVLASGQLLNQSGSLVSQGTAAIRGGAIVNTQGSMQSAAGMSVSGASLQNDAGRVVALGTDGLSVTTTGQILNAAGTTATGAQGGVMGSNGATVVQGGSVVNHGAMSAATNLTVSGQSVDDSNGTMASAQTTTMNAGSQFVNANGAVTGQTAVVNATTINNDSGNIQGAQVGLNGTNLQNHAGVVTQTGTGPMAVNITGTLDNSQKGTIQSNSTDLALTPATLINDTGTITHAGSGTLTLGNGTGSISNVAGHIASNGQVVAQTETMNNTAGSVIGQTGLTATVGGALTNDAGRLGSGTSATIHAGSLSNQNGGSIVSPTLALNVDSTLNNNLGSIQTNQATIAATDILNRGGNLTQFGTGPMTVNVANLLDNSQGGVFQTNSTNLLLTPAMLMNDAGKLTFGGTGTLTIAPSHGTGAFSNVGGTVVSNGQAVVQAGSWNNDFGTFAARQGIVANVAGDISNQQGLIRSQAALSLITGGSLLNQNGVVASGTSAPTDTSTLAIQAAAIQNAAGQILNFGTGNMTVQGGSQLVNAAGMVSGNGNLAVNASAISNTNGAQMNGASLQVQGGTIDNTAGKMGSSSGDTSITTTGAITDTNGQIGSAHDLTVTAPTLSGGGTYSAANNAQFNLQGNFSLSPHYSFNAGNQLGFSLPGTFTNTGYLSAVYNLNVSAGDILNSGTMMAGNLLSTHSNTLTNTGTMVGASASLVANTSITNVGPTALIGASDSNGTLELLAPVIQNRDDTTAVDTTPQTSIVGLGKVVLAGGKDANGNYTNAQSILNQSALIQSGGDMTLDANLVTNTRRQMTTSGLTNNVDPAVLAALGISLSGCASYFAVNCVGGGQMIAGLRSDNITPAETAAIIAQPGGMYIEPPHGGQWNSGYFYTTYTGVATANLIQNISPAAQIMVGGNLDASATGTLKNYWSNIAAVGNIKAPANYDANSWGASGQQAPSLTVTYSGQYHYNNYDSSEYNWQLPFGNATFVTGVPGGYTQVAPANVHTYPLPSYESTFVTGGTLSGNGVNINNTAGNAGLPSLGLVAGQVPSLTPGSVTGQLGGTGQRATVPGGGPVMVDPIIAKATALNVLNNLTIPQGGLFKPDTAPGATYLIETNPAFTNQRTFMSSDYYLQQLGMNPQTVEKRLGDGFYEQQLVRNQVTALTGKAVLGPYTDTQAMYEAMMASGAALAKSLDLPLGMSLTADEVASLTSNVVMMETRVVDGQSVLVPVVYLAKANQQNWNGPLIAATDIDLENAQTFKNSGTVTASDAMTIHGQSIDSAFGALTSGGAMDLQAIGDMNFTSANVKAGSLNLDAGGNLLLNTATNTLNQVSATGATRTTVTLGPLAQINVTGDAAIKTGGNFEQNAGALTVGGNLGMDIGGNWNLGAVQTGEHKVVERANGVSNTDINVVTGSAVKVGGESNIAVGGDLTAKGAQFNLGGGGTIGVNGNATFGAASATSTIDSNSSGSDHHGSYAEQQHSSDEALLGTAVHSGDTLTVASGKDINVIGSSISLDKGNANLLAKGDVNVGAATETHTSDSQETHSHSNVVSGVKVASGADQTATYSQGSTISADGVTVESGRDINVTGSNIVGTDLVSLDAARNVNITTSQDTVQSSSYYDKKESGLLTNGGLSVTFGSRSMGNTDQTKQVTNNASVVGASSGNVSINAGKDATITGSTVVAGQNLDVTGQNVVVNSAYDTYNDAQSQHFSQSGLSVGVNGGVVGLGQSMASTVRQGAQSGDSRLAAVQGVAAAEQAYQSRDGLKNAATALSNGNVSEAANGVQVQLSIGSSHSSSNETTSITQAKNSSLIGNGNVHVTATGTPDANGNAQPGTGDITMTGASVLGKNVSLDANNAITLHNAQSTEQDTSSNSSSGWNAGVGIGVGKQTGISIFANGTNSHGQGNGSAVTQTNTTIAAGDTLTMKSGGDTTLTGAQVSGDKVKADVGGNLTMTSVQDTSNYASNQHSAGASGSVTFGYGGGADVSIGHTGIDANYASVNQQTGIVAGKDGFDVNVANHTQLNGAQIASAAPAESNTLTTGSLGFKDIQNSMSYSASSEGFSTSSGPSFAHTGDSASGVTKAAVSPATITVTSDQQNGTDSTAGLSRDTANANQTVKNTFNLQQTQNDLAFAQAFGKAATFAVAEAATQLENSSPQMKALFGEGGAGRDALHAAVAAIGAALSGGNIGGAVAGSLAGDALQSLAQPIIDQAVSQLPLDAQAAARKALNEVVATAGGAAGGALAGGGSSGTLAGAGAAANNELYNRQLHESEAQKLQQLQKNQSPQEQYRLAAAECALVHCADNIPDSDPNKAVLQKMQNDGVQFTYEQGVLKKAGAFDGYGKLDSLSDAYDRNQISNRLVGAVQGVGSTAAGIGAATGGCYTLVACIAGAAVAGVSFDYAKAGFTQLVNGNPTPTYGELALQSLGMSPGGAALTYAGLGLGAAVGSVAANNAAARAAAKGVPQSIESIQAGIKNDLMQQVADVRATLTGSARTTGNVGVAEISVPGIQPRMVASSQIDDPTAAQQAAGLVGKVPETFISTDVMTGGDRPILLNRSTDSEAKILNNIAAQLGDNTSVSGVINLFTERPPCTSCSNVIQQFQNKYPNITINVMDNNGVIKPSKR
ncbi:hemagglutinin repeat-containing protein [Burkholderia lata]|uniref:Filamentous hemagglutinin n=1 Tax=Burkholderia lata (strain ATCC 17760 / DSM 23089 / LMG 22485 / NCIMB 9086 / R18194 / 383) TaxID=482957 RepID=A0A6P2JFP0_BURL3|nr:hemagglutinin repeat-containing protein [Burkholderia lata]VWB41009.1 filamentous hemagglutinin [Burkholderia lata]